MSTLPLFPPVDPARHPLTAPITEVILLEDRAIVRREGYVTLTGGSADRHRLVLHGPSPLLQDVSLRAEILSGGAATVADARVQRALRARQEEQTAAMQALQSQSQVLHAALTAARDDSHRAEQRYWSVLRMILQGISELPQDVAWGLLQGDTWGRTFDTLFGRARELRAASLQHTDEQQRLADDLLAVLLRIHELQRREYDTVAWIELDLVVPAGHAPEAVRLAVTYTVGNALWRPLHRAELRGETLRFHTAAAIWQQTGEDWSGVQIVCSTARASLGIEPPLLADDLLQAQRKAEQVRLAARQVAVQQTGPSTGDTPVQTAGVELPGVDDGGEVQNLRASRLADVPSDGRLVTVPLASFTAPTRSVLILLPEIEPQVHLKSTQHNTGSVPILAGPVELIRDSGAVGWGEVLFVAPGAAFTLGFGPQDELRVHRLARSREKTDAIDKWTHRDMTIELTLSNIGAEPRTLLITERIPVSEVEEVRVTLEEKLSTPGGVLDPQTGFYNWTYTLPGNKSETLQLRWRLSVSPGVSMDTLDL